MNPLYSVHLSTAKTWRGGENQLWLLARGLHARGQRVTVLAPGDAPLLERCVAAQIPAQPLNVHGELDPLGALRLVKFLRREKPDILHLHDGHAVMPGQFAAHLAKRGLRIVVHRRTVFNLKGRWKYGGRVDRVIAISSAVREKLLAAGIEDSRIRVVFSGLEFPEPLRPDAAEVLALRHTLGLAPDDRLIAHAAALTSEKRQRDIIQAIYRVNQKLKAAGSRSVHLALAGTGDQEETLRTEVRRLGTDREVHFLGFVKDLRPLWAASAAAVFASEAEGLCTALVEAQGAGLPAVATRAGGMVEVIEEGATGLLADVSAVDQISDALLRLMQDEPLRGKMGAAALVRAREKFSADSMVEGVLSVYKELCNRQ